MAQSVLKWRDGSGVVIKRQNKSNRFKHSETGNDNLGRKLLTMLLMKSS